MTGPNGIERIWSGRKADFAFIVERGDILGEQEWDVPLNAGPGDSHLSFETIWYRVEADRELAEEAGGFPLECRQEQATRTLA